MENQLLDAGFKNDSTALEPTTTGRRFANYLIDTIVWYVLYFAVLFKIMFSDESFAEDVVNESGSATAIIYAWAFGIIIGYYFLSELLLKGRTIGKFLTGTRAIRTDGQPLTAGDAIKRSLCRLVPFEQFSFLGNPVGWHDKWTDTMVVNEKDYQESLR